MMPDGGYYSSKKTDDICEDVCGQVFLIISISLPFHIWICSLIFHRIVLVYGRLMVYFCWVLIALWSFDPFLLEGGNVLMGIFKFMIWGFE